MCNHVFSFSEDTRENYNSDGKTLMGICKYCGLKKKAYGMRWAIKVEESLLEVDPYNEVNEIFDKSRIIC